VAAKATAATGSGRDIFFGSVYLARGEVSARSSLPLMGAPRAHRGLRRTPLARPSRLVLGTTTSAGDLACWGRGLRASILNSVKSCLLFHNGREGQRMAHGPQKKQRGVFWGLVGSSGVNQIYAEVRHFFGGVPLGVGGAADVRCRSMCDSGPK
jgi:hypothetical protein